MARPRLEIGEHGRIFYSRLPTGVRARTFYRGLDGDRHEITRMGRTRTAADSALKKAIRERVDVGSEADITPETLVKVVAERWYEELTDGAMSPNTLQAYRDRLDRQVIPRLGNRRCREVTVGVSDRFLQGVVEVNGPGTAKMTRSVLSGVCAYAARHDAMPRNPVRDVRRMSRQPKKPPRSFELLEGRQFIAYMTYHDRSVVRDLPDLVLFMLATGLRIGEACAVVWDAIDLEAGTVEVRGTVVRIKGVGLRIKPRPKTTSGWRKLKLPDWTVTMLRARRETATTDGRTPLVAEGAFWPSAPVFAAPRSGGLRDGSNTQAHLRKLFDFCGVDVTSHAFRKTVATLMERAGLSSLNAADQLGHAQPSMTADVYFGRYQLRDTGAATVLSALTE